MRLAARRLAAWPLAVLIMLCGAGLVPARADDSQIARGAYLFGLAGCGSCHTDRKHKGPALAGGRELVTRFGTFVTPNISPDPATGIGRWSDGDFLRALRHGISPQGQAYYPAFPYTAYSLMSDDDILAIRAYLAAQPPVVAPDRSHRLKFPYAYRPLLAPWRMLFFREGPFRSNAEHSDEWNRGAYLARAIGHCSQCHTPMNFLGAPIERRRYAGTQDGPDGLKVPDITPDAKALGSWSMADLTEFLKDGFKPNGDVVGGPMAEVIRGTAQLTPADLHALAVYLKSLPPLVPESSAN